MKCTIRCELSKILKMIPILRWKYTLIMIIIMTIITFIITIITLSYPQNNTQHNPQDSTVTTPTTPTTWSLSIIWSWFSFWDSELGIGRYLPRTIFCKQSWTLENIPFGNLIVKTCLAIYYLKWYYVKRSDVLQYHMMEKNIYYDIQHGSTICCNGHVVTSVTRFVHQVVLFIDIVKSYNLFYIQCIKILIVATGSQCTKKNINFCFHGTYHKKTKSCRKHFWHRGRNDNIWFV